MLCPTPEKLSEEEILDIYKIDLAALFTLLWQKRNLTPSSSVQDACWCTDPSPRGHTDMCGALKSLFLCHPEYKK